MHRPQVRGAWSGVQEHLDRLVHRHLWHEGGSTTLHRGANPMRALNLFRPALVLILELLLKD